MSLRKALNPEQGVELRTSQNRKKPTDRTVRCQNRIIFNGPIVYDFKKIYENDQFISKFSSKLKSVIVSSQETHWFFDLSVQSTKRYHFLKSQVDRSWIPNWADLLFSLNCSFMRPFLFPT